MLETEDGSLRCSESSSYKQEGPLRAAAWKTVAFVNARVTVQLSHSPQKRCEDGELLVATPKTETSK